MFESIKKFFTVEESKPRVRLTGIYNDCCKKNDFYLICKHCNRVFEYI